MRISFDLLTGAFLGKVTEYDFISLDDYNRKAVIDGYIKRACSQFNNYCLYNLNACDENTREICADIPEDEIPEIVDIVSEGMLVQWMKPYLYKQDNLKQILNTKDFTSYSPSELLKQISSAHNSVEKRFLNMMREYSYVHGDLTELHL